MSSTEGRPRKRLKFPTPRKYRSERTLDTVTAVGSNSILGESLVATLLASIEPNLQLRAPDAFHYTGVAYEDLAELNDSFYFIQHGTASPEDGSGSPACSFRDFRMGSEGVTDEMVVEVLRVKSLAPGSCERLMEVGTLTENEFRSLHPDAAEPEEAPMESSTESGSQPGVEQEELEGVEVNQFCGPFPDCRDPLGGLQLNSPVKFNSFTYSLVAEPAYKIQINPGDVEPTSETLTYVNWQPTSGCATPGIYHHFEGRDWLVARFPGSGDLFSRWNLDLHVPDNQGFCSHVFSKVHAKFRNDYFFLCPTSGEAYAFHYPTYTQGNANGTTIVGSNTTYNGACSGLLFTETFRTPAPYGGEPLVPVRGVPSGPTKR